MADATGRALGFGEGDVVLDPGRVRNMPLTVFANFPPQDIRDANRPAPSSVVGERTTDMGDQTDVPLPEGVDNCHPLDGPSCGVNGACALKCQESEAVFACGLAGNVPPGGACAQTSDCQAGSQCFPVGCDVRVCLAFCQENGDGCGTNNTCGRALSCGGQSSGLRLCRQTCDPTGAATSGCAQGLNCLLVDTSGRQNGVDCLCADARGDGTQGVACQTDRDCQPGFMCVARNSGAVQCSALCKRQESAPCPAGLRCAALPGDTPADFGVCLE